MKLTIIFLFLVSREGIEEDGAVLEQFATHAKDFSVAMEQVGEIMIDGFITAVD